MQYFLAAMIGLLSGVTSGLFGVGGGIIMVPAMLFLLSPPIRDIKQAIGTSLLVILPTAMVGSYKHFQQLNVDFRVALWMIPSAVVGGWLGAWLTTRLAIDDLKRAFGGLLILVGIRLLFFK